MTPDIPPEIIIRDIRPGEEAHVVSITLDVWENVSTAKNICDRFGDINGHPWTDHKADQIVAQLNKSDVVLVAEDAGALVAFATLVYDRKYAVGTLGDLGVARAAQNKGLGRRMLRAALARMRSDAMKYARIDTLAQNERALRLYASEGFAEVARTAHFFQPL